MTADEIGGIALFADLGPVERERLSRLAADLRIQSGEYLLHAGDERALFALLEGRLETIKIVDGIETVVGGRVAGDLVGEVPIALGTTFPFGFRAAEASRVMRIEARDYHSIAAAAPEIGVKLGALARGRIGGLQGITASCRRPEPSWWVTAGTRPVHGYDAFSTGTRSRSGGSHRMRRTRRSCGEARCPRATTAPSSASSTGEPSSSRR